MKDVLLIIYTGKVETRTLTGEGGKVGRRRGAQPSEEREKEREGARPRQREGHSPPTTSGPGSSSCLLRLSLVCRLLSVFSPSLFCLASSVCRRLVFVLQAVFDSSCLFILFILSLELFAF